ncbi:MAG: TonB-dependent receptor [Gemmatimonadales bacterium]
MNPALLALAIIAWQDTSRATTLDTVVVTAERVPTVIGSAAAAVTRITAADLAMLPHATVADALRLVPGFALVDFDGLGLDPQLMVRGFYGGGEAEYVVVLLDGRPMNQLHSGRVSWDALPALRNLEAIEVLRGSASALYGDAAIGGVINVITRHPGADRALRWSVAGGTHDSWRAGADLTAVAFGRTIAISSAFDRSQGFRTQAERTSGRVHAAAELTRPGPTQLTLSARSSWRGFDEPGPLLDSLLLQDREGSDVLFRFDHTRDQGHAVTLDGERRLGAGTRLSGSLTVDSRHTTAIRTLALAPGFGDTKERALGNTRVSGTLQLDVTDSPLPGADRLTVGADLSRGWSDSRYYRVASGDRDAYAAATGERGALDAAGEARRGAVAVFAQYSIEPAAAVRLVLGARFDHLSDALDVRPPGSGPNATTSHDAFSPKLGLNIQYARGGRAAGTAYVTLSRSFKAPTVDQLFDQRSIPIPDPPFALTTSNPALQPQYGTSIEAGVRHHTLLGGTRRLSATFSVYQMSMRDEIDFDVQTLRYVNIGRSRHRGIEAGLSLSGIGPVSIIANYTLQSVTIRTGEHAGNALKALPRHAIVAGLSLSPLAGLDAGVLVSHARDIYLDDANTVRLPPYTRVDAHLAYHLGPVELLLEATNLLDARYSTTGFLDPAGSGQAYFHPAAGRVLQLGVRSSR